MRWNNSLAHHAIGIVVKLGGSIRLAKHASFSFGRESELDVTNLLVIVMLGSADGSNPVGSCKTVMNRPGMQSSLENLARRHEREVKVRNRRRSTSSSSSRSHHGRFSFGSSRILRQRFVDGFK